MKEEYLRTAALIGEENLNKLKNSTVAVFGLGGVGSYAAEALVRSGIGTVYIYDSDKVAKSNINRQLIALSSTVGTYKTEAEAARLNDIDPDCNIIEKR
ncbi:MAG: ThiF family adenylyltransferase, partial [Acutalibacteraceae bacterium]|nr:ThiF family adenylyltransferase [Acutalibacteraceae bacterium]